MKNSGQHPRHHELADRVGPQRSQSVNLIGHHHRASSAAMPDPIRPASISPVSTGSELLDHRRADQAADERPRAELIERDAGLQGQHRAGEKPVSSTTVSDPMPIDSNCSTMSRK